MAKLDYLEAKFNDWSYDDYVIICGDTAITWDNGQFDESVLRMHKNHPWTTLYVHGNHDNVPMLDEMPQEDWHGGKINRLADNVFHLVSGYIFDICGHSFFAFGGAASHDMWCRKAGLNWWAREMPTQEEYDRGRRILEEHEYSVDFIISHEICGWLNVGLYNSNCELNDLTTYFNEIYYTVDYKLWFNGHHHRDIQDLKKQEFCYQQVRQIHDDGTVEIVDVYDGILIN